MAQNPHFILIGLPGDSPPKLEQNPELRELIREHRCFSGGKRHYEHVRSLLPEEHEWIPIESPLQKSLERYEKAGRLIVFVSGDPFFFGFGKTLKAHFPEAPISSYPAPHSLQLLAQRLESEHGTLRTVSLHGRGREDLYSLLLRGCERIGVLTDANNSPDQLARDLLSNGYGQYRIHIGECLGGSNEKVRSMSLHEAAEAHFDPLNCLILIDPEARPANVSHPDTSFHKLPQKPGMITKRPIRSFTLALLRLNEAASFWDIGTCTGSLAIEAQCSFPDLRVTAFEKKEEAFEPLDKNLQSFGTPAVRTIKEDFLEEFPQDLEKSSVDRIFIGGHGGELEAILAKGERYLNPGGLVALNAIREASAERFKAHIEANDLQLLAEHNLQYDEENPITVLLAQKRDDEKER